MYPENTLPAFAAAIAAGAQEIEFDLRPAPGYGIAVRHDPFKGSIPEGLATFEDVLAQFARRILMNIHVKTPEIVGDVVRAIDSFGCQDCVYLTGGAAVMEAALALASEIERCCLEGNKDYTIVKHAIKYQAGKVQFRARYFTQEMIDEAHANGIRCNVFYTDCPAQARKFFHMGIDTILTNNCTKILKAL